MLPNIVNQLPKYKDDAVVVTAMREATHRNLYAIVNSCGMNRVGKDTTIKPVQPIVITLLQTSAVVLGLAFAGLLFMYIFERVRFYQTTEHIAFKELEEEYNKQKNNE